MNIYVSRAACILCIPLVAFLAGCGSASAPPVGSFPTAPVSAKTSTTVYVIQSNGGTAADQVLTFPKGSGGNATPSAAITTNLALTALTSDTAGQIYAAGYTSASVPTVNVYPAGATGAAMPVRSITLTANPFAMATDSAGSLFIVDKANEILVFSASATGAATPARTISGANTTITGPQGITVDAKGAIYLADFGVTGYIDVFAPGANGNVAPATRITAPANTAFAGVAVDGNGNIYASTDLIQSSTNNASVLEYAPGANSAATPVARISGTATGLSDGVAIAGAIAVDGAGNMYLPVEDYGFNGYTYTLLEFAAGANGNVAPYARFTSSAWTTAGTQIALQK